MICEALILALNRHSYSVGNFLGYHKKSSSLFEKYIPFSSPPESVSLVAVSPHWGIDALEPESSFPNLRQKSCLGGFLVVSHRFSCEFMELHLFVGVESVNTFPISTLLPGVVSGKMAQWQFSWIVLLISGASGLRMRQVALCPRTLCSGVLSEVFFAKHLSISICKILQVPSKNWESRKGTADVHVQQLMCHNWFSHFISKLQDSNLRFDTGWDESFLISGEWRQCSQGRFSIGSSSRFPLSFSQGVHIHLPWAERSQRPPREAMVNLKAWYHVSKKPCPIPWLVHQKAERIAWRNYITRWLFQVQYFPFIPYFEKIFNLKLLQGVEATRLQTRYIYLHIYIFSVNLSCRVMFDLKAHTVENPHKISPARHVRSWCWMRAVSLKLMESFISFFGKWLRFIQV